MPTTKVTYSHTGFYSDQTSYFNIKVLVSAEPGICNISTTANIRIVVSSVIALIATAALERCIKTKVYNYVHHSQATPIRYTFLIAVYQSSTAKLSYKSL